jgi:hypothetical protein
MSAVARYGMMVAEADSKFSDTKDGFYDLF